MSTGEIATLNSSPPGACGSTPAVTSAVAEISPNDVLTNSTGEFVQLRHPGDDQWWRHGREQGGDHGTGKLRRTDDHWCAGRWKRGRLHRQYLRQCHQRIDLTTKVTASSKITVLFDSDAPTTQDLTGVTFLSTVDDSGTGDVAQSTTEGNGDGDAGDNDSWTVTTTDAGAGSLVGQWNFDEGSGQSAADSSGNGNNGTLGSTAGADADDPTWACVNGGYALNFDGTDDLVNAGSAASLDDLGPITISAWIKPDVAGTNALMHVMSKSDTGSGRWMMEIDNTGENDALEFNKDFDSTDVFRVSSDSTIAYDVWQHVAATWDGSGTAANIHLYKNGLETSYQTTNNGSATPLTDAALPFVIGNRGDGTDPFYGLIDDVRVYNSVLSSGEITTLAASAPVDCSGDPAVTSAIAEISPTDVTTSSTGNSFSYDIQATISGSDTGVNRVAITVPGAFGAPTVTDVEVDGTPVAYTDNTSGNAISIDLTTKVTASSKITVLFDSDAPTTQDLTGVDFTSTVDDHTTGDAAQATTEGNGDGDAGRCSTPGP